MLGDTIYKEKNLENHFSFNWNSEWYSNMARIIYAPIDVESGKVVIEYEFED